MTRPRRARDAALTAATLDARLAELATLDSDQLRRAWVQLTDTTVPRVSPALLRLALAYAMQASVHGGLSRLTQQRLAQVAAARTRTSAASPGMRLVREWQGKVHVVTISEDAVITWNGTRWSSLSAVARAITGTRWSGPAFFGLKVRAAA